MPGFGASISTFIWLIAIIIVLGIVWRGRKSFLSGTPIVLKTFQVDDNPMAERPVEILGRTAGFVGWMLSLLRLEPDVQLVVTKSEVSIREASLGGILDTYIPLAKISASVCGYQRSVLAFAFAVLFGVGFVLNLFSGFFESNRGEVGSDMGLAFGFLILAGIAGLIYFLSKRIAIFVETMHAHGVIFKRSVIENVTVDLPDAERAISVINARVRAAQGMPSSPPAGEARPCPQCSAMNPPEVRFCEDCGAAIPAQSMSVKGSAG